MPKVKVTATHIEWETDGQNVTLPETMTKEFDMDEFDEFIDFEDEGYSEETKMDVLSEAMADHMSDETGWLVNGFNIDVEDL